MSSERLLIELRNLAPNNQHPLPWTEAWDGAQFTVDLSYRTDHEEVDTTAINSDIYTARRHAISNLKRLLTKN